MDKQDIIDGLDVILGRRGEKITQGDLLIVEAAIMALANKPRTEAREKPDWQEIDRLDALGTFGARIIPYNGVWKIMLNETNCELWSLRTHDEAQAKLADALKKSGYSDDENPLVELAKLKASVESPPREYQGDPMVGNLHCACIFHRSGEFEEATLVSMCAYHAQTGENPAVPKLKKS